MTGMIASGILTAEMSSVTDITGEPRRTYIGKKQPDGSWPGVIRRLDESATGSFSVVLRHRTGSDSHSPTGFSWGYGGSGPAETAHGILLDFLNDEPNSALVQHFKWDVVAHWDQYAGFTLPGRELQRWLEESSKVPREHWTR